MKPLKSSFLMLSLITSLFSSLPALGAPEAEQPSYKLTRTVNTPLSVQFSLSKDVFRQEPYEAEYIVQIPYTDTESYYEDVPYTDTEAYTDWETYYESEYRCRHETRYRQECRTETICGRQRPGRYPDNNGPGGDRPGRYPGNGGGHGGGSCRSEQICERAPYTENVCGYESVPRTRMVTRYRTVTRYRSELRTRTVTKYRSETRCCETRYRDVFDHQYSYYVTVKLPEVSLSANETEMLFFELHGDEKNPQVVLKLGDAIYSYKIAKQEVSGANIYVELITVHKYDRSNAGSNSIGDVVVEKQGAKSVLKFTDQITDSHVKTNYEVKVNDINKAPLGESISFVRKGKQIIVQMNNDLSRKGPAVVEINVRREGPLVKDNILVFTIFKGVVLK